MEEPREAGGPWPAASIAALPQGAERRGGRVFQPAVSRSERGILQPAFVKDSGGRRLENPPSVDSTGRSRVLALRPWELRWACLSLEQGVLLQHRAFGRARLFRMGLAGSRNAKI